MSLGQYKIGALSWMFRKAKLPWEFMWQIAVGLVLKQYGITEGVLVRANPSKLVLTKTPINESMKESGFIV